MNRRLHVQPKSIIIVLKNIISLTCITIVGKGASVFDYALEEGIKQNISSEIDWPNNACDSYNKYLDDVSLLRQMKVRILYY